MNTPVSGKTLVAALALLGLSVAPSWAAVTGRYVRLEIPEIPSFGSNQSGMSHMSEFEVHSGGKNAALQSTPNFSAPRDATARASCGNGAKSECLSFPSTGGCPYVSIPHPVPPTL